MVILDIISLASLPLTLSTIEGPRLQPKHSSTESEETRRLQDFRLHVYCDAASRRRDEVDGTHVVLRGGKLWLSAAPSRAVDGGKGKAKGDGERQCAFEGFYLDIQPPTAPALQPATSLMFTRLNKPPPIRGLVSSVPNTNPQQKQHTLNWIYIDPHTLELKYAPKASHLLSHGAILGPFDWTSSSSADDAGGLTLEGWEGFVAVEEAKSMWALYYDRADDLLSDRARIGGRRVLRVSLERRVVNGEKAGTSNRTRAVRETGSARKTGTVGKAETGGNDGGEDWGFRWEEEDEDDDDERGEGSEDEDEEGWKTGEGKGKREGWKERKKSRVVETASNKKKRMVEVEWEIEEMEDDAL